MTQEPIFEQSCGNVFADLGIEDADELFTRGKIGIQVLRILKQRNLKQREISELFGIPQPEVSHLMKGEFQRFSEGKLLTFLKKLDIEVILHLRYSGDRTTTTTEHRTNEIIISL
jgi:predicted XRE-type DNA-binding protein